MNSLPWCSYPNTQRREASYRVFPPYNVDTAVTLDCEFEPPWSSQVRLCSAVCSDMHTVWIMIFTMLLLEGSYGNTHWRETIELQGVWCRISRTYHLDAHIRTHCGVKPVTWSPILIFAGTKSCVMYPKCQSAGAIKWIFYLIGTPCRFQKCYVNTVDYEF